MKHYQTRTAASVDVSTEGLLEGLLEVPSTNPSGGGVLYSEGGALKWRGSGGTITTIAPA